MKKNSLLFGLALLIAVLILLVFAWYLKKMSVLNAGRDGFARHCSICHAGGGNEINPQKTLSRKDLNANSINTPEDIVIKIRNHRPGEIRFDKVMIPDKEAEAIGYYVLKTFQ
jgi:mono/diheme cytochrome c family protein